MMTIEDVVRHKAAYERGMAAFQEWRPASRDESRRVKPANPYDNNSPKMALERQAWDDGFAKAEKLKAAKGAA